MRRFVYLAGPIAGCSFKEATNWREAVAGDFAPGIVGISPMRCKEWCKRVRKITSIKQYERITDEGEYLVSGESHAICARDRNDILRLSDMLFVYLPKVLNDRRHSWGTGHEMGLADGARVPIVLVTDDKQLATHPLIRESVGWIVPTLELGIVVVNSVLEVYVGEENNAFAQTDDQPATPPRRGPPSPVR